MVVTLLVANYITKRILVDRIDILFWDSFVKMNIDPNKLKLASTPLKRFSDDIVQPMGAIALPIIADQGKVFATIMTNFLVVKAPPSYIAIIGHPILNCLKAVTSTYHLR